MIRLEQDSHIPNVIVLSRGEDYFDLIAQKEHRPYDVVLFTNLMPKEQEERCPHCFKLETQIPALVNSFVQDRKNKHVNAERRIFFVKLYIDRENDGLITAFQATGYGTVPWISVSPQPITKNKKVIKGEGNFFEKPHEWNILNDQDPAAMKLVEFVNNVLKTDVQLKLSLEQLIKSNAAITGILAAFVVFIILFYKVLLFQWLWLFIALSAWIICAGGLIHNKQV